MFALFWPCCKTDARCGPARHWLTNIHDLAGLGQRRRDDAVDVDLELRIAGRAEDPNFTIKVMVIGVGWSGATAEERRIDIAESSSGTHIERTRGGCDGGFDWCVYRKHYPY
jgi:hypothetical protein